MDEDLGDFTSAAHDVVELRNGCLTVRREGTLRGTAGAGQPVSHRMMLTKRLELSGTRLEPVLSIDLEVANTEAVPQAFELDLSFCWNLAGGGHNPSAYYAWVAAGEEQTAPHDTPGDLLGTRTVAFGNRYVGVHVAAEMSRAGRTCAGRWRWPPAVRSALASPSGSPSPWTSRRTSERQAPRALVRSAEHITTGGSRPLLPA